MGAQPRCVSCGFWEAIGRFKNDRVAGTCHRFPAVPALIPPTLLDHLMGRKRTIFLEHKSAPDDWCGEHRPYAENDA